MQRVIANAGFAAEVVHNDYGEDLLVQTAHAGEVDASRLWIQVKGTTRIRRYRRGPSQFRYPISLGHALKWVRSADLVVVVLWDVERETGYYAFAGAQFDEWSLASAEQRTIDFVFDVGDVFDEAAVKSLAWESRINHYRGLMLHAADVARERDRHRDEEPDDKSPANGLLLLLALEFMDLLGMLVRDPQDRRRAAVTPEVVERFKNNFRAQCEGEDAEQVSTSEKVVAASIHTLLCAAHGAGQGLPFTIIHHCSDVLIALLDLSRFLDDPEDEPRVAR